MNTRTARGGNAKIVELERQAQDAQRLRQLADAMPVAVASLDAEQRYIFVNRAYARQFGRRAQDVVGTEFAEVLGAENYRKARPYLEAALAGQRGRFETQVSLPGAGVRHVEVTYVPEHRPDGIVTGCFVSIADITEHKRTERALRQSEQRFRSMADLAPAMIWIADSDHRCTFLSRGWYEYTGQTEASALGVGWLDAVHPDDRERAEQTYANAARRREAFRLDYRIRRADGEYRWAIDAGQPCFGADAALEGYVGSVIDVHERKQVEEHLRESEQRFREMTDGLPLIVWVHDENGEQEFVNGTFCEFFGVRREEMKGGRWRMLMHPDDAPAYLGEFASCVRDRRAFHHEVRVKRADGAWRRIESWGRPRFTSSGEFRGFVGTSADITARKQAEAALRQSESALRQSEERLRHLADSMPQLVWIATDAGTVTYYNHRATQYRGLERKDDDRWSWEPVVHPDEQAATLAAWRAAVQSGSTYQCEHRLCMADGAYRWHLSRAYRLRAHDGTARWFGTATDIHEVKEAQEALREADRRKDEFLAMLGHELRNPLAAIRNATDFVKLVDVREPRLQRAYGVLERQTVHMSRLIEGLLEVSRIARGKIQLDCQPLDLREVVETVLHDRGSDIAGRGLVLQRKWAADPLWVWGDSVRLAQVFDNLVSNAIKFTDAPGEISVAIDRDGADALVRMSDTGVGIRTEFLPRIFDPFQQETQDIARAAGGLGLGLALAKGLVELHRGTIEARSAGLGAGAEFRVRLPLTSPPEQARNPALRRAVRSRRILVVEDNQDAAEMLRDLLEVTGHQVSVIDNGPAALEHLRQHGADVVLCDIGLPHMNGYEFAGAIRADASLRGIALVALTGYGQPEDRKRAQEAGFDEHLVKPVDLQVLEQVLDRFADGS